LAELVIEKPLGVRTLGNALEGLWKSAPMEQCACGQPVESRFPPRNDECRECRIRREHRASHDLVRSIERDCGGIVAAQVLGYFED
jgi:hypothetical protein